MLAPHPPFEEALGQALLETLVRSAPLGIGFLDREMRFRMVNDRLAEMNGLPVEAHLGRTPPQLLPRLPPDWAEKVFRQVLESGAPSLDLELTAETPASPGVTRHWIEHWFPVRAGGEVAGVAVFVEEITSRRQVEQTAAADRDRFMAVLGQLGAGVVVAEPSGKIVLTNEQLLELLPAQGGRHHVGDFRDLIIHSADGTRLPPNRWPLFRALGGHAAKSEELQIRRSDGVESTVVVSAAPIRGPAGALVGAAAVIQDISELRKVSRELERAVGARDALVSMALHDLRTPIATVRLAVKTLLGGLREGALERERVAARLESIDQHTSELASMLTRLLDFSRLAAGRMVLVPADADLTELVRSAISRLEPRLSEARCELTLTAEEPLRGRWDRTHLEQVVSSLVGNALKYAPGNPIAVRLWRSGRLACFSVRDHGPGIPPGLEPRLFQLFTRASTRGDGVGLGLWVVRKLVELHGGQVRFESAPGEGATFTVELPLAGPPEA